MNSRILMVLALFLTGWVGPTSAQDSTKKTHDAAEPEPSAAPKDQPTAQKISEEEAEASKAKTFAIERLRALSQPTDKAKTADKAAEARLAALREVFKTRERLIVDWEKTFKARRAILNPDPTPEDEIASQKTSLDRLKVELENAKHDPQNLVPESLRNAEKPISEARLNKLKDAAGDAEDSVENLSKELETFKALPGRKHATPVEAAKAERDEVRKRITALGPRGIDAETALSSATSADERELARERIENLDWETKLEAERLKEVEARLDLEVRRAVVSEVKVQVLSAKLELAKLADQTLRSRYVAGLEQQRGEREQEAAREAAIAAKSKDPLERYKARRKQEINQQKSWLSDREGEWKTIPGISLDDQRAKADKAEADFEKLKKLVEGGRSSTLVAQRLNNSFRRLSSERASITRNELTQVTALLGKYENELTAIELDQLNDDRGDRSLRENLLASLPKNREQEALALFTAMEKEQRGVSEQRRSILSKLEERAEKTRAEVLRRLRTLDNQHAFVRTHLFWVRDAQPLGTTTVERIRRESSDLGRTVFSIASDPWSRSHWERISFEFMLATVGLLGLPYVLYRTRIALRQKLAAVPNVRTVQLELPRV